VNEKIKQNIHDIVQNKLQKICDKQNTEKSPEYMSYTERAIRKKQYTESELKKHKEYVCITCENKNMAEEKRKNAKISKDLEIIEDRKRLEILNNKNIANNEKTRNNEYTSLTYRPKTRSEITHNLWGYESHDYIRERSISREKQREKMREICTQFIEKSEKLIQKNKEINANLPQNVTKSFIMDNRADEKSKYYYQKQYEERIKSKEIQKVFFLYI